LGFPAEAIEAMMMAWLADLRIKEIKVDTTTVTGASRPSHLGAVYLP
jgi:1,6-anhydro-N-acetylmuramate kinase